jgi:hypothetical protein
MFTLQHDTLKNLHYDNTLQQYIQFELMILVASVITSFCDCLCIYMLSIPFTRIYILTWFHYVCVLCYVCLKSFRMSWPHLEHSILGGYSDFNIINLIRVKYLQLLNV